MTLLYIFTKRFLSEYDPKLRKSRGVWYTPEPVVNFIVRAVDDILKTEFGLKDGLADTSKVKVKRKVQFKAIYSGYQVVFYIAAPYTLLPCKLFVYLPYYLS